MKEIIHDFIHCTEMEFLIKHPFVIVGLFIILVGLYALIDLIRRGKKMKTETKRLLDWAKSLIKDYKVLNMTSHTNFRAQNVPAANHWESEVDNCEKFAEFLNSLPVPDEKKKELHELYEKELRGEE